MAYAAGPFDSPHFYLQWGGKLPGNETWSVGLRMASASGVGTVTSTETDTINAAVLAFHTRLVSCVGPLARLSFVKFNALDINGHYVAPSTTEYLHADVAGGGSSEPKYPNQVALAVSLTTGWSRGPAHKGRIYLPIPSVSVDTNGVISVGDATAVSASVDTLIAALNAVNADRDVAIFSRKAGAPAHRVVTGTLCGRVLDTQRRRRRSVAEDYQ